MQEYYRPAIIETDLGESNISVSEGVENGDVGDLKEDLAIHTGEALELRKILSRMPHGLKISSLVGKQPKERISRPYTFLITIDNLLGVAH